MQMAPDDGESDANIMQDLGNATNAPILKDRASDDSVQELSSLTQGSAGHDFYTAKQKARQFNALSVVNKKREGIDFGMNDGGAPGSEGGNSDNMEGAMQMDNDSEASGMMQMAEDDDQSNADGEENH